MGGIEILCSGSSVPYELVPTIDNTMMGVEETNEEREVLS